VTVQELLAAYTPPEVTVWTQPSEVIWQTPVFVLCGQLGSAWQIVQPAYCPDPSVLHVMVSPA
jgi:hypothetical protein